MKVVYKGGEGEITEKKSRFIATVRPVESEGEASAFIGEMKKKYWDARHNCSAFVVGSNQEISRCSDDGEPAQTAGRPMLDVLLKEEIHNAAVVVTRYFGGVLLGTGGLVRAYQQAVQEGLSKCTIVDRQQGRKLAIHTDYNGLGKIQHILAKSGIMIMDTEYTDQVVVYAMVPAEQKENIINKITDKTNGTAGFVWLEEMNFALLEKEVIIL